MTGGTVSAGDRSQVAMAALPRPAPGGKLGSGNHFLEIQVVERSST
jgi:RNA-splicing ligase RtcB